MLDKEDNNSSTQTNDNSDNNTPYRDTNTYVERTENNDGVTRK